jgi:hypothetical protein
MVRHHHHLHHLLLLPLLLPWALLVVPQELLSAPLT